MRVELQLQPDTGEESRVNQISDARTWTLMIGAIIKEFMARTRVDALVNIKLLDNIDDCSVGWGLQCRLPVSESLHTT